MILTVRSVIRVLCIFVHWGSKNRVLNEIFAFKRQ